MPSPKKHSDISDLAALIDKQNAVLRKEVRGLNKKKQELMKELG
jgi:hypothetical protein